MVEAVGVVLGLVALALSVPLVIFSLEIICGLRRRAWMPAPVACSVAILVPAHNESAGIAATLRELLHAAPADSRIVVVADNCTDDTARLAATFGVEAITRNEPDLRGKGYALAFGRVYLGADPPDVVIVADADCRLDKASIEMLASAAHAGGVPVQANNTLFPDLQAPPLVQLSNFAFLLKNAVRAPGFERLGGATLLTGTGMAFPWRLFAAAPLATDSIVEDLALGVTLIGQGIRPKLLQAAAVRSAATAAQGLREQRARWERGFIGVARRSAIPSVLAGLRTRSRSLFFLGLHLLVPPMASLVLVSLAALVMLVVVHTLSGAAFWGLATLAGSFAGAVAATFWAWLERGRDTLSVRALLAAPFYVLWKVPSYLSFVTSPRLKWRRARRDDNS